MQRGITPYLYYEDAAAAIEFLTAVFGFHEVLRRENDARRVWHAELALGDGRVMLGEPGPDYRGPNRLGATTASMYVYVDDVDAHYERARAAGVEMLEEPGDRPYGERRYGAEDLEGHQWYFATPIPG
jgi:uncharacterized glyoxalase superfamily protein PhnB